MTTTTTTDAERVDTQPIKTGEAVLLDIEHARRIAASTVAASRDAARPILGHTTVSITDGVLQTAQTDSYRMSWTMTPIDHEDVPVFSVVAKDLEAAFKQPTRNGRHLAVTFGEALNAANHMRGQMTVQLPNSVVTLPGQKGTFPNWRKLIDEAGFGPVGKAICAGELFHNELVNKSQQAATEKAKPGIYGFNPRYLADLNRLHGYTDTDRSDVPVRPIPPETPLKPALWTWVIGAQCGAYLLMPVRV